MSAALGVRQVKRGLWVILLKVAVVSKKSLPLFTKVSLLSLSGVALFLNVALLSLIVAALLKVGPAQLTKVALLSLIVGILLLNVAPHLTIGLAHLMNGLSLS